VFCDGIVEMTIITGGDDDDLPTYVPLLKDQDYITDAFIGNYET